MANSRKANGKLEIAGLILRGTITSWNPGKITRTEQVNAATGDVDFVEAKQAAVVNIELSYVTDVELNQINAIVEEPAVLHFIDGSKVNFPSLTCGTIEEVNTEGAVPVRFFGPEAPRA